MNLTLFAVVLTGCASSPAPVTAPSAPVKPAEAPKPAAAASPAAPAAPAQAASAAAEPGARSPHGTTVINPGFESMVPGRRNNDPEGWFSHQHAGTLSYRFTLDTTNPRSGARSLRIENIGPEPYGAITQTIDGKPYRGKTVRLSAWLRTQDTENAALTLAAMSNGIPLANNFMSEKPVKGTTGWTRYTITLPVAPGAEFVEVGAMIQGKGSLWFDDVEVEVAAP
ncbi:MAG: hypothetical protein U1F54_10835 [Burkholderiales bacterium]